MKNKFSYYETLLSSIEPEPVGTWNSGMDSPWLFLCEHACNRIPLSLNMLGLPQSEINRHIGWDIGILDVTKGIVNKLNAPLIFQHYSRLVIDCNRPLASHELIPSFSENTKIRCNRNLHLSEREKRINEIWRPYQESIQQHLARRVEKQNLVVSMHSFTPVFKGKQRPWHIGLLYNRAPKMALALKNILKKHDPSIVIGMNQPYTISDEEDYTIPAFGEKMDFPHVLIEIRQDLINKKKYRAKWIDILAMACRDLEDIFIERKIN